MVSTYPLGFLTPVILSRESEYGLEGLMVLACRRRGTIMLLQEIAEARRLPPGFLARIFQKLRRHNLVSSHRVAVRGYALARPPGEITLLEIFEAIEGPSLFERCIFWPRRCQDQRPCSLHGRWTRLRARLRRVTEETTLEQVASPRHRKPRSGPG